MRVLLCANPASGGETDHDELAELLRARGADVEHRSIDDVSDPVPAGIERLVVAGGDGSIGPAAQAAAAAGVPLAVLPTGTANDFARALEIPLDVEAAADLAADPGSPRRTIDLAHVGDRPFVNAASAGLAPAAARAAHPYKKALGPLAYAVGALKAGLTTQPTDLTVEVDGEEAFAGEAWQLVVGSTGAFGGGSSTGAADPGDGRLDVAVVPAGPRVALVKRAWAMRAGRLARQDGVVHARGARVVVRGGGRFNVDGEVCDCGMPADFGVRARAVDVVVPR